jgi:hypothetical protein
VPCRSTDMSGPLLRTGKDLPTICEAAGLDAAGRDVLTQHADPHAFVRALIERGLYGAAVGVLAHALPAREGVYWAWSSAREAAGPSPCGGTQLCLAAAREWICEPSDANRHAAFALALENEFESAASLACAAAFCSGGSLAPDGMPDVPPDPHAAARAIRACVMMAAVIGRDPDSMAERYRRFLAEGMKVAERAKALEPVPSPEPWSQSQL